MCSVLCGVATYCTLLIVYGIAHGAELESHKCLPGRCTLHAISKSRLPLVGWHIFRWHRCPATRSISAGPSPPPFQLSVQHMAHPATHHAVVPPGLLASTSGVHFNRSVESIRAEQSHYCGQGWRRGHGAPPRGVQKRGPRHGTGFYLFFRLLLCWCWWWLLLL